MNQKRTGLIREAGGFGDIVCVGGTARQIKKEEPDTQIIAYCPNDFIRVYQHLEGIDGVWGLGPLKEIAKTRRPSNAPIDPDRLPYAKPIFEPSAPEEIIDLFCPARIYEATTPGRLRYSRPELFCMAAGTKGTESALPVWKVTPKERQAAWDWIGRSFLSTSLPLVGLAPRATAFERSYPLEFLPELLEMLSLDWNVVYLDCIRSRVPFPENGRVREPLTDVFGAAAIIEFCDFVVTVDSFALHAAAALDTPSIGLFGPTTGSSTVNIYPLASYVEGSGKSCQLPCHYSTKKGWKPRKKKDSCAKLGCERMKSITPDVVMAGIKKGY